MAESTVLPSGDKNALSERQKEILVQFRENVSDVLQPEHDDHYLVRWLRARCFDLKKSEDMLRKSVEWRKKWQADTVLTEWTPPEVMVKYFPGAQAGHDKEGAPVWVFPSGGIDMKGLTLSAKKSDIIRYTIFYMQSLMLDCQQQSEKLGERISMGILINDLEGFTMKKLLTPGMDVLLEATGMVEANYPESLKQCYIVNAGTIFPFVYRVMKPFLSEDTKKKIRILGKNWKEELLKVIDADQLPQHWGGTQTGPEGSPWGNVCMAGDVPSSYYMMGHQVVDPDKVQKVTVTRRSAVRLPFEVTELGQVIRWVFWTEGYDIKFGVLFKNGKNSEKTSTNDTKEAVIPLSRVNCHLVPEDGCVNCDHIGSYEVVFDNSYSWIHTKKLFYSIELVHLQPDETHGGSDPHQDGTPRKDSSPHEEVDDPHAEEIVNKMVEVDL